MRIYVASSWRNARQPEVVQALRTAGHEGYDFRNPAPGNNGFHWSAIDPDWRNWDGRGFLQALSHPIAESWYGFDKEALDWCNACVMVMPCGRSAHLEAGYTIGQGKPTAMLLEEQQEPELMYKLAAGCFLQLDDIVGWANKLQESRSRLPEFRSGHTKAWFILHDGSWLCTPDAKSVVAECVDPDDDDAAFFTLEQVNGMRAGDSLQAGEWRVECQMVDPDWMAGLREHDGW